MAHPPAAVRMTKPSDCLEVASRAECQALVAAQAAAEQAGESVNVQQCISDPTPQCEAALRQIVENQNAASQRAGE